MEYQKQLLLVKKELMKYAMCSDVFEIKKMFYQNINNFGKNREWFLLCDIFKYSCDTMNEKLLESLYEIYETIDISISRDNNPDIFYKSILFQNTLFYTYLLSHQGPSMVFNKNKQNLIDFTINKRCRFMPILELLKTDEIIHHIQIIIENAIISYDENIMSIQDEEYINNDYVYMVYESEGDVENLFEKKITRIPISVRDDQFINFLYTLKNNICKKN